MTAGGDRPLEPDAIGREIGPFAEADNAWIEAAGFAVTRQSPPVGSVAAGFPGVGFDLMVPDESGHLQLVEAYDADGQRVPESVLTGARAPAALSEAVRDQWRGHDDTDPAQTAPDPGPGCCDP